jgi:hypothetical protein
MSSKQDVCFDKRIVSRSIKKGLITRKEYEQYLKSLKDATEKAVPMFWDDNPEGEEQSGES